jgi:catechol 2,3-dioxygenase-like lactoylglutathione lyase family enzyme
MHDQQGPPRAEQGDERQQHAEDAGDHRRFIGAVRRRRESASAFKMPGVSIRRVVPNFRSDEPAASRDFYETLGFGLGMDMDWIATFVSPSNPTAQVTLIRDDPSGFHPDSSVEVEDLDGVHAKLAERGFDIVYGPADEPWGVRRFFVRDPNGIILNVMQHRS